MCSPNACSLAEGSSALDSYPYSSATCSILCLLGIQMQVRRVIKLSGHDHLQLSGHDPPPGTLRCSWWWSLDSLIYNMQRSKSSSLLHPPPRCTTRTGGRAYRLILTCTLGNPPIPDSFNPWFLFPLVPPTCRARCLLGRLRAAAIASVDGRRSPRFFATSVMLSLIHDHLKPA